MFSGDELDLEHCLALLCRRKKGLHVGGKSALALFGVGHNLVAGEEVSLWGPQNYVIPKWFKDRFPSRYTERVLFKSPSSPSLGIEPVPEARVPYPVSRPERALLEMLSEVGVTQGVAEARSIMEGVTAPRLAVLIELLKACRQVKTLRLCLFWAKELRLAWADSVTDALREQLPLGRWVTKFKDGSHLILSL